MMRDPRTAGSEPSGYQNSAESAAAMHALTALPTRARLPVVPAKPREDGIESPHARTPRILPVPPTAPQQAIQSWDLDVRPVPSRERVPTGPDTGYQLAALGALLSISESADPVPKPEPEPPATGWRRLANAVRWPLPLILAVQAALTIRLNWVNTAFMDEALYIRAGHLELAHWLHGTAIPPYPTWFSGAPVIYPPLAAIADSIGGLAAARALSLLFMLAATTILQSAGTRLFSRSAGLCGAAAFACLGSTAFIGSLATYDAMALFLLALSCWFAIRANGRSGELMLVLAGFSMALADATKYATALWNPVVIALAILAMTRKRWLRAVLRGIRVAIYTAIPLVVALLTTVGPAYIKGIDYTTLTRASANTPPFTVLESAFAWVGMIGVLAIIGWGISLADRHRNRWLCVVLTLAVALAPLEEARIHTLTSLNKHVDFGAWFAAIAAGYGLAKLRQINVMKWAYGMGAALALIAIPGVFQATTDFQAWPNTTQLVAFMKKTLPSAPCPCLASQEEVLNYYLYSNLSMYGMTGPTSFVYVDPISRKKFSGTAAYQDAIKEHYFDLVEVDCSTVPDYCEPVQQALQRTPGYVIVAKFKNTRTPQSPIFVWRYER